jgi:cytochrome c oxidase cbb3-type subunit 4
VSHDELIVATKIIALLMFMPIFVGVTVWAYWPANKAKFEQYAQIPLQDD